MKWIVLFLTVFAIGYGAAHVVYTLAMRDYHETLTPQEIAGAREGDIVTKEGVWTKE